MPGRKIRLTTGSSLIIIGTSLANPTSKSIKGKNTNLNKRINLKFSNRIHQISVRAIINSTDL